ncbi:MAG: transposase [Pseudomonadota bacterium]
MRSRLYHCQRPGAYIREVLVPEIASGTVVILDNLATHRNKDAAQALRDHGCWSLYLPPYSPDLSPIEQAFSKLKAHLQRIGAKTITEVFEAIGSICDICHLPECWNYFKAAGYVSSCYRNALLGQHTYDFGYAYGFEPGQNRYPDMKTVVLSDKLQAPSKAKIIAIQRPDPKVVQKLVRESTDPIYLCGGGDFARWMLGHCLRDKSILKRAP